MKTNGNTPRDHLSVSQINLYLLCPRKYAFTYVEKIPRVFKPIGWAFGGAIQIGGHMESVLEAKEEKADESRFSITQRKSRLGRIRGRSTYQLRMGDDVAELVWDSNMLSKEVQAANVLLNEVAHTGQLGITEAAAVLKGAGLPGTHAFITGKVSVELRASPLVSIRGSGKLWVLEGNGEVPF